MKLVICSMLATAALLAAMPAHSESAFTEGVWHVSPMGTYMLREDKERLVNGGFGGHFGVGRGLSEDWAVEMNLVFTNLDGFDELNQWGVGVDVIRAFGSDDRLHPYAVFGLGHMMNQTVDRVPRSGVPFTGDDDKPFMGIGGGIMYKMGEGNTLLRTDVRYRHDFDTFGDLIWNFGVVMPFGASQKAPMVEKMPEPESDSDKDGVVDSKDRCSGTRAGAAVDMRGCELDSDGDGVANGKDKCANTPRGTKVDMNGCKLVVDSDGDGVMDNRDSCPNTKAGVRVDGAGCEVPDDLRLPGVEFKTNTATLLPNASQILDVAVEWMKRYPRVSVEAQGHTDSQGKADYNQQLSQKRAESVRAYLISKGVQPGRITARGFGETQPFASNDTREGRAKNRRVVLKVVN